MSCSWPGVLMRYLVTAALGSVVILFAARQRKSPRATRATSPAPAVQTHGDAARARPSPARPSPGPGESPAARNDAAEGKSWGVTQRGAKAYDRTGHFLRDLAPGTLVEIEEIMPNDDGDLARCTVLMDDRRVPDILVRTGRLDVQPGALEQAPEQERALRSSLAALSARQHELDKQLGNTVNPANPHAREYRTAKAAYDEFWKEVRVLQKRRDTATGAEHVRYSDMLRRMKGEDIRIGQRYEGAKQKYEAWETAHPSSSPLDKQIAALAGQIRATEDELRALPR